MQTTLLGLAIAFIIALMAALIGPYYIDWDQFRPQFEAEATRVVGAEVRVGGKLDARLLPTPTLRLRSVVVGGANDLGKVRADKLDVEFSLGDLMRGEWRANELTIDGMNLDLGLDAQGRVDWPATNGTFNLGTLAIDRLNLTGRVALHDAASRTTLELNDLVFGGDVRSLAGSVRGEGHFNWSGARYPFRVSSGQIGDGRGNRIHLSIDPGERAWSADLEGVLSFETRTPHFEGAVMLAGNTELKAKGATLSPSSPPWRISAKLKADPMVAKLEQLETSYGSEDRALKLSGFADIRFGASPLLHATLSARQLDADRFLARDDNAAGPIRWLPGFRAVMAAMPQPPIPTQLEFGLEQIMLGGRPLQNIAADLHSDTRSWTFDLLDFRAPGATHVDLNARAIASGGFRGALDVESTDPDALAGWLQGRNEISDHGQKPLRLRGNVTVAPTRLAIEAMQAEIDGGAVEGSVVLSDLPGGVGSRLDAVLKAERLDLDAATALARALAGPAAQWPDEAQLTLDIGRAVASGQELRPFAAKLGYNANIVSLYQLKFGSAGSVLMEGAGTFDRVGATGKLALNASAAALGEITAMIAPLAPALASRLDAMGIAQGPARLKLTLDLDKASEHADRGNARIVLDLDAPQFKGAARITAKPDLAALRGFDLERVLRSDIDLETKLSSDRAAALLVLLGLDREIAAGEGAAQFEATIAGGWRAPLRLQARMSGAGLDADAQGTAEPWAPEPRADVDLRLRRVSLAPLLGLKPFDPLAQNFTLSSHLVLRGKKLNFEALDGALPGSRLRGHFALTLDDEKHVEGEVGMDVLDLGSMLALAVGTAGREPADPVGPGWVSGWRGHIAFQALHGDLPGGGELRPVAGSVSSDGQSLTISDLKGGIGGGEASATIDARQSANAMVLNARVQLSGIDGTALRYRALAMPAGRVSMQMTIASQGRSASALVGALSGNGTVTLEGARIPGLDPRAFEVAIRLSDSGQIIDDARLRKIVEPALASGALSVKSAQIPFIIRDGRLRVTATSLDAVGASAIISGGFDFPADQADIRVALASTAAGAATSRPEIQLFAAGSPDALNRSVDVTSLSSWLAVRTIDRETRRLDAIERGEPPVLPASIPSPAAVDQTADAPAAKAGVPPAPAAVPGVNASELSPQVAPLPPPIEIRPAPGTLRSKPKPPLSLTPATPSR